MVRGLDLFRARFRKFEGSFILIGGAACDEWFAAQDLPFRATKDLDIVLLIEALTPSFVAAMRRFVADGGYEIRQGCHPAGGCDRMGDEPRPLPLATHGQQWRVHRTDFSGRAQG